MRWEELRLKLWTMQPVEVYDILLRDGIFRCDPSKIPEPSFANSYGWLMDQLDKKCKKPDNVQLPIWAWFRFNKMEKKPDLRHNCYGMRGEKMVCLELDVPDEEVLLSDFDLWHHPLNNWWLDDCFRPDYNEDDYDKAHKWFDSLTKEEQKKEKEKSWHQIFNIEPFESDWILRGHYVQAIFWELKQEYVKKVQYFTAR